MVADPHVAPPEIFKEPGIHHKGRPRSLTSEAGLRTLPVGKRNSVDHLLGRSSEILSYSHHSIDDAWSAMVWIIAIGPLLTQVFVLLSPKPKRRPRLTDRPTRWGSWVTYQIGVRVARSDDLGRAGEDESSAYKSVEKTRRSPELTRSSISSDDHSGDDGVGRRGYSSPFRTASSPRAQAILSSSFAGLRSGPTTSDTSHPRLPFTTPAMTSMPSITH